LIDRVYLGGKSNNWKNTTKLGFQIFAAFCLAGKIDLRFVTGELAEIVDEMRLVIVTTIEGNIGQRLIAAVFFQRSLKANDPGIHLWREAGKFFELSFELPLGEKILSGEMPNIYKPAGFNDVRYRSKYLWLVRANAAKSAFEKIGQDTDSPLVISGGQHPLFQFSPLTAEDQIERCQLIGKIASRETEQFRQGKRIEVTAKDGPVAVDYEARVTPGLGLNAGRDRTQSLVTNKLVVNSTVMKYHLGAAIGVTAINVRLSL